MDRAVRVLSGKDPVEVFLHDAPGEKLLQDDRRRIEHVGGRAHAPVPEGRALREKAGRHAQRTSLQRTSAAVPAAVDREGGHEGFSRVRHAQADCRGSKSWWS